MVTNLELNNYLHQLLIDKNWLESGFSEPHVPNGLQVHGSTTISKVLVTPSLSIAAINAAAEQECQAMMVHHGFMNAIDSFHLPLSQHIKERYKMLLNFNLNLYSYHLPLDYHATVGNNATGLLKAGLHPDLRFDLGLI